MVFFNFILTCRLHWTADIGRPLRNKSLISWRKKSPSLFQFRAWRKHCRTLHGPFRPESISFDFDFFPLPLGPAVGTSFAYMQCMTMWRGTYQVINQCARKMPSFRREAWISSTTSIPTEKGLWNMAGSILVRRYNKWSTPLSNAPLKSWAWLTAHNLDILFAFVKEIGAPVTIFLAIHHLPHSPAGPISILPRSIANSFFTRGNNPKTHGENGLFAQISKKVSGRWKVMDKICKIVMWLVNILMTQCVICLYFGCLSL